MRGTAESGGPEAASAIPFGNPEGLAGASPSLEDSVMAGGRHGARPAALRLFTPLRKGLYVNFEACRKSENPKTYVLRHLRGGFLLFGGVTPGALCRRCS